MDCVRAVVDLTTDLHNHALIYIKTSRRDLFHDRRAITSINEHKAAHRLFYSNHVAVVVARGALLVIYHQYFRGVIQSDTQRLG